jgi:hypothetical protein
MPTWCPSREHVERQGSDFLEIARIALGLQPSKQGRKRDGEGKLSQHHVNRAGV